MKVNQHDEAHDHTHLVTATVLACLTHSVAEGKLPAAPEQTPGKSEDCSNQFAAKTEGSTPQQHSTAYNILDQITEA
jgi:hypothetical protein